MTAADITAISCTASHATGMANPARCDHDFSRLDLATDTTDSIADANLTIWAYQQCSATKSAMTRELVWMVRLACLASHSDFIMITILFLYSLHHAESSTAACLHSFKPQHAWNCYYGRISGETSWTGGRQGLGGVESLGISLVADRATILFMPVWSRLYMFD